VLECDGYAVKGLQQLTTNCCGFWLNWNVFHEVVLQVCLSFNAWCTAVIQGILTIRDVAKPTTLGGGGGGGGGVVMFWPTFPRILTKSYKFPPQILSMQKNFLQSFQFFQRKHNKSFKIANHFISLSNFDHLLSRVLPSLLSKYQFHFDQIWANISSILTNSDQRLNYWWGVTPPPPPPPYSDVPADYVLM
jgi:hypothetical protein